MFHLRCSKFAVLNFTGYARMRSGDWSRQFNNYHIWFKLVMLSFYCHLIMWNQPNIHLFACLYKIITVFIPHQTPSNLTLMRLKTISRGGLNMCKYFKNCYEKKKLWEKCKRSYWAVLSGLWGNKIFCCHCSWYTLVHLPKPLSFWVWNRGENVV